MHDLLRKAFGDIMEKTKPFDVLLIQTWGKFTQQNMQKFTKLSTKTEKLPFQRSLDD
jgi:RNA-binding protein YlmH